MKILIRWIINALIISVIAYILPGVHVNTFLTALVVSLLLGIINVTLKPILLLLTLPISIVTLGIFALIINGAMILLVSHIVSGFRVDGLLPAILFSIILAICTSLISHVFD